MDKQIKKLEYYICLFLYALKNKKVNKHTLFRYVYIYDVVCDYLGNYEKINEKFNILYKKMTIGMYVPIAIYKASYLYLFFTIFIRVFSLGRIL